MYKDIKEFVRALQGLDMVQLYPEDVSTRRLHNEIKTGKMNTFMVRAIDWELQQLRNFVCVLKP